MKSLDGVTRPLSDMTVAELMEWCDTATRKELCGSKCPMDHEICYAIEILRGTYWQDEKLPVLEDKEEHLTELRLFVNGPLRPLTFEEAGRIPIPWTTLTIEAPPELYDVDFIYYSGNCTPGGNWNLEITEDGQRGFLRGKEYGKTWRIWPQRPTEELARNTPWEEAAP